MTPKEKAKELYNKCNPHCLTKSFYGDDIERQSTKLCALIAVEEILKVRPTSTDVFGGLIDLSGCIDASKRYWQEVKQEIELL